MACASWPTDVIRSDSVNIERGKITLSISVGAGLNVTAIESPNMDSNDFVYYMTTTFLNDTKKNAVPDEYQSGGGSSSTVDLIWKQRVVNAMAGWRHITQHRYKISRKRIAGETNCETKSMGTI